MKQRFIIIAVLLTAFALAARAQLFPDTIEWSFRTEDAGKGVTEVVFSGIVADGWHTYGLDDEFSPTRVDFDASDGVTLLGQPEWNIEGNVFTIRQKFRSGAGLHLSGTISWNSCTETSCRTPEEWHFDVAPAESGPRSLLSLILEAVLWGLLMLLTPCVFPMVPMTVSFFIKGSGSPSQGRFKAAMYGLFIVLLYTLPICAVIGITRLAGGESVTADIFNWLSTHWLPNIIFFVIFMVFAASFFGAFEFTLPGSWANSADSKSDRKGLAGIFFLALTLVLVSFSCTGPIVGTVLIKSTRGEFWVPMVTMLAFSVAFALPFTFFAFFPSLLKKLPKSGGWLNTVKVVLGFVEIALGFKFLSTADQTYHWHILDREVYLAIWIVCFSLLGLYLLGRIRFKYDTPVEYLSFGRFACSVAVFAFVVYLIPGMWGAPLKALSGYLPPIGTQDFVVGRYVAEPAPVEAGNGVGTVELPLGLVAFTSIEDALEAARIEGKPVFVDITGHGCVNCREMESRVWSDPQVCGILRNDYVIVALYTDDKTRLPESEWVTTPSGAVLKDVGRVNSYIVRERFGVNSQPNYALLDSDGKLLAPVRGYDLDVQGFVDFLKTGTNQ